MTAFLLLCVALGGAPPAPGLTPHESLMKLQALTKSSRPAASSLMEMENDHVSSMLGKLDGQLDHLKQFTTTLTQRLPGESNRRRPYSMGIEKLEDPPKLAFEDPIVPIQHRSGIGSLVEKDTATPTKATSATNGTNATNGVESLAEKGTAKAKQPEGDKRLEGLVDYSQASLSKRIEISNKALKDQADLAAQQMAAVNEARLVKPPEIEAIEAPNAPYLIPLGTDLGAKPEVLFQRGAAGWAVLLALVALLTES